MAKKELTINDLPDAPQSSGISRRAFLLAGLTVIGGLGVRELQQKGYSAQSALYTLSEMFDLNLFGEFQAPIDVPFDAITWTGVPRQGTFTKGQWPKVRQWAGLVEKESKNYYVGGKTLYSYLLSHGYDLNIVLSIIWMESEGNPLARNPNSDATGVMQVMPRDGKGATYGKTINGKFYPYFADRPTILELMVPSTNIAWGMKILAENVSQSGIAMGFDRFYGGNGTSGYWDMAKWLYSNITT